MYSLTPSALILCAALSFPARAAEPPNPPALDGWDVVIAKDASASEVYAAEELTNFVAQATGAHLPIRHTATAGDRHIYVGPSEALAQSPARRAMEEAYGPEDLRIVVAEDHIVITGGGPRGTLYGVYQFLEDRLGARFLTADHTHLPDLRKDRARAAALLRPLDYTYWPPLAFRLVYYTDVMDDPVYAARLRLNSTAPGFFTKLGEQAETTGFVDPAPYMLLHSVREWADGIDPVADPTVMALWNGKRLGRQPCLTHPDVIAAVTRKVTAAAARVPENGLLRVVQEDAPWCECDRCRDTWAQHGGAKSAVVIRLVNHVAREVAMERPDVRIGTLAYAWSAAPPDDLHVEPNVRIQYATYHACLKDGYGTAECPTNLQTVRDIHTWKGLCDDLIFWHYAVNYADYLQPPVNIESIGNQLRAMMDTGTAGIFQQGPGSGINLPFADMMIYLIARLLWNPDLEPMRLVKEFVDLHYGAAATEIHAFLALIRRAVREHPEHSNCNGNIREFGLTPEIGRQGIEIFQRALAAADSPAVRDRVAKASVGAYRVAIGGYWYGDTPVPDAEKQEIRKLARTLFALTARYNVAEHREGGRMEGAENNLRKALGMEDGEAF